MTYNFTPGIYKHYKGGLYELIAVGRHSETLEEFVLYQALYGDREYWVRPASMWEEEVDGVKRFSWVRER